MSSVQAMSVCRQSDHPMGGIPAQFKFKSGLQIYNPNIWGIVYDTFLRFLVNLHSILCQHAGEMLGRPPDMPLIAF